MEDNYKSQQLLRGLSNTSVIHPCSLAFLQHSVPWGFENLLSQGEGKGLGEPRFFSFYGRMMKDIGEDQTQGLRQFSFVCPIHGWRSAQRSAREWTKGVVNELRGGTRWAAAAEQRPALLHTISGKGLKTLSSL